MAAVSFSSNMATVNGLGDDDAGLSRIDRNCKREALTNGGINATFEILCKALFGVEGFS